MTIPRSSSEGREGARSPLGDALVGAVRGRIRECGRGTPFPILSAMGSEKDGARAATTQHAGRSHRERGARRNGCTASAGGLWGRVARAARNTVGRLEVGASPQVAARVVVGR